MRACPSGPTAYYGRQAPENFCVSEKFCAPGPGMRISDPAFYLREVNIRFTSSEAKSSCFFLSFVPVRTLIFTIRDLEHKRTLNKLLLIKVLISHRFP